MKLGFSRERFMYVFIIAVLFVCSVGPYLSGPLLTFLIVATLIFTIAMGKYLDFPWAVLPLERWHDLMFRYAERKALGKDVGKKTEPILLENDAEEE